MRIKKSQRLFTITVQMEGGLTRTVKVKAASRDVAENRALKRTGGVAVQRPA